MAEIARATPPPIHTAPPADIAPRTPTSLSSTTLPIAPTKLASPAPAPATLGVAGTPVLSPKSTYKVLSPRASPRPLTGAAALADAQRAEEQQRSIRQSSPNPRFAAVNALKGHQGTSRASDGPPPTVRISEPLRHVIDKVTHSAPHTQPTAQAQAVSTQPPASYTPTSRPAAMTATAAPHQNMPELVEEPESMDEDGGEDSVMNNNTRPYTYPGPPSTQTHDTPSRRDLSFDSGPKSGTKRHKCPYCATDFTRHHNLKSHLLTHSQEKPYVCQECNSRFRRLHDLKRHNKLHTGERPHICPKCGRKFARGDALARHNKGPGGCANRKSSFGGEDGEDDMDDTMDGMDYDDVDGDDGQDGELDDAAARRVSEPSRKRPRPDASLDMDAAPYRQQSSTYPPPQMVRINRPDHNNMGPPSSLLSPGSRMVGSEHGQMSQQSIDNPHQPQYYSQPSGTTYALPHVTESPRPLSPRSQEQQQRMSVGDASALRNRSPSMTSNFQHQQQQPSHYARGSVAVMPTHPHNPQHATQLPSFGSLAASHASVQPPVVSASSSSYPPPTYVHVGSNPGSHSSHGHSSTGSIRDLLGTDPADLMAYIRNIEQRFSRMQDEYELRISRLQSDVIELKKQVYKG